MTDDYINVAEPGEEIRLPLVDILTGRGFVTGKSGSGKSNSVNVIVEELLDRNQPLLIVDTDGEYWGLKEQYQILHLGNGDQCDVRVTATDAETIVDLALVERVPIILDISGFLHKEDAQEITHRVVRELFHREKSLKEPFLLIVEEVHEYIPESGGLSDMGKMLIQVAKRGRKHGLGFVGVSQRPASVDKDFITQCDWIVWHRLTWKNDTDVVSTILGSDAADTVEDLDPGEALLMSDWDEQLRNVQIRRKRTFDAGATPGFDDFEPPELIPVNPAILNRFDERRQNVDYGNSDDGDEDDEDHGGVTPLGDAGDGADDAGGGADDAGDGATPTSDDGDGGEDDQATDEGTSDEGVVAETVPVEDEAGATDGADTQAAIEADAEADDAQPPDTQAPADTAAPGQANAPADVPADASATATGQSSDATPPADEGGEVPADRPPLGDEPVEAEIVARQPDANAAAPRNSVGGSTRRGRRARQAPAPPTDTSEGLVVEFAEMMLFLAAWIRAAIEDLLLWVVGGLGRIVDAGRALAEKTRRRTALADEDVVVAMWLALLIGFILLLSVVLVAVL